MKQYDKPKLQVFLLSEDVVTTSTVGAAEKFDDISSWFGVWFSE